MTAHERALWCVLTGQPWELYPQLTYLERDEFVKAAEKVRG